MNQIRERLRRYRPSLRGKVEQPESVRVGEGEAGELELGRLAPLEEEHALVVGLPGDVERRPHRPTRVSARGGRSHLSSDQYSDNKISKTVTIPDFCCIHFTYR